MLVEFFKIEVLEIGEDFIEIKGVVCDLGLCVKIVVKIYDQCVDLVGVCVGMCGVRVQVVFNELGGECIDIVLWDDNVVQFVINVMFFVDVVLIVVDEDCYVMDIVVDEDQLVQVIGKGGQNICFVSELVGWDLNVMIVEQVQDKQQEELGELVECFMVDLDVDEDVVVILVEEGFISMEEVVYVLKEEMMVIDGFDEDVVDEL